MSIEFFIYNKLILNLMKFEKKKNKKISKNIKIHKSFKHLNISNV